LAWCLVKAQGQLYLFFFYLIELKYFIKEENATVMYLVR